MKRKQRAVLHRDEVTKIPPRLQELEILLRHGPKTIHEIVTGLALETAKTNPVAIARTYLSKLGRYVPITVHFRYRESTYEILENKSRNIS